jgi:hypothetical protein
MNTDMLSIIGKLADRTEMGIETIPFMSDKR